jgi:hypothetical protein
LSLWEMLPWFTCQKTMLIKSLLWRQVLYTLKYFWFAEGYESWGNNFCQHSSMKEFCLFEWMRNSHLENEPWQDTQLLSYLFLSYWSFKKFFLHDFPISYMYVIPDSLLFRDPIHLHNSKTKNMYWRFQSLKNYTFSL